jgi:hypothetical protein
MRIAISETIAIETERFGHYATKPFCLLVILCQFGVSSFWVFWGDKVAPKHPKRTHPELTLLFMEMVKWGAVSGKGGRFETIF